MVPAGTTLGSLPPGAPNRPRGARASRPQWAAGPPVFQRARPSRSQEPSPAHAVGSRGTSPGPKARNGRRAAGPRLLKRAGTPALPGTLAGACGGLPGNFRPGPAARNGRPAAGPRLLKRAGRPRSREPSPAHAGRLPTFRPRPPGRRSALGLTLIEMLVVLVLVSLLGTLLVQGTGFFLGKYATVKRVHRDASLAALRQHLVHLHRAGDGAVAHPRRGGSRAIRPPSKASPSRPLARRARSAGPRPLVHRARWRGGGGLLHPGRRRVLDGAGPGRLGTPRRRGARVPVRGLRRNVARILADHERRPPPIRPGNASPAWSASCPPAGRTVWLARTDLFPEPVPNYREDL